MSFHPTKYLRDNPYRVLLATAWRYAAGMRGRYLLIYGLFTGVNLLASLQPVIYGMFVDYLQTGSGDLLVGSLLYVAVYVGLILLYWAFHWPARIMERQMAFDLSQRLLLQTYERVIHLPLGWHRAHHSGDTINRARKAYEALKNFFDNGFLYFQTIVRMLLALAAIIYFSPLFGAVAGLFGVVIVVVVLSFDRPIINAIKQTNEEENELMAGFSDKLTNIITVTALRLGRRTAADIARRVGDIWPPFRRNTILNERKWFTIAVLTALMYGTLVYGYVRLNYVPGEVFLIGGLVTLIGYVTQFTQMLNGLTAQYNAIVKYRSDLAATDPIDQAYAALARPAAVGPVHRDWERLRVEGLSFRYAGDGAGVFDVALNLDRGRRIALVGPSGSGKTTALYALRGLYPPDRIRLDFQPPLHLRPRPPEVPAAQLFEQTTLIPQSPEIFEDTLRNNLTMGLDRTAAELQRVIETAVLTDVVEQAPNGLDTFLSEGGANLSGGQRQRLSIARGLLAADTSTLLLLDEPTSSLDPKTEVQTYERIFAAYPDKTIVSTLHRLHLLRFFDYVYYLEGGRVVAEGTLAELLRSSPGFRKMYDQQVGG